MTGDLFITSLMIFPVILVVGYLVEKALWGRDMGPFVIFVNIMAFVGVFIHEVSHALLSLLTGVPVKSISIRLRRADTGEVSPHGEMNARRPYQRTFLQSLLTSLGPVLLGAWIFYFALEIAFNSLFEPLYRILAGLLALSVLIASTPSPQDFRVTILTFNLDPRHSFYQIILLTGSFLLTWGYVELFNIIPPMEFLYYIIFIIWYFTLKFSLIGIQWGINKIRIRFGNERYRKHFRRFSRRTHKPLKLK